MAICNLQTVVLIMAVVLVISFTEEILTAVPVLSKLFTDPVNFILMIIGTVLVLLVNLPSGILVAFLVLYMAVYIKHVKKNTINRFTDIVLASQLMNAGSPQTINGIPSKYLSESEFTYDHSKAIPNGNISPFKPVEQSTINHQTAQIVPNIAGNQNDFITSVGAPNRDGYDVSGCRYDFKDSPQNLTQYGPPLAQCATYNSSTARACGNAFYPLNA